MTQELDIRIGTLVGGNGDDPAGYIRQIAPYGFESFSITFWQTLGGVDLARLAESVREAIGDRDITISTVGIFGNPLEQGALDLETAKAWETLIDNAHLFGADIVSGFTGRLRGKSIPDSISTFKEVFGPLAKRAEDKGVRLAFENCAMDGTWQGGDWNLAHNPAAWELLFDAVPSEHIGLEWEPCHQMVSLIEPLPQIKKWAPKIFHVHGKDATIKWDVVKTHGVFGSEPFAFHRTPGFGDTNWTDVISELRWNGFRGAIDIEGWHDPVYVGDREMTGQVHGLRYLKGCRGEFIPNPV
ncbi:sugar phosphate isomerase [Capsulimonas corticalis]|uniref:Sugar phosphate isomerase n=1 Tax=Capsulimonas corticalis TaxID=2219043 RepID=A0A402CNW9_9BACT|nr:sugar phosphate isomerase/epimerase [Capsulimonas corticalis]BDI33208.1 sugar phosphate isomerase [Capsulimonas corticalis]